MCTGTLLLGTSLHSYITQYYVQHYDFTLDVSVKKASANISYYTCLTTVTVAYRCSRTVKFYCVYLLYSLSLNTAPIPKPLPFTGMHYTCYLQYSIAGL